MKRVLITGVNGFIGRNAARMFFKKGYEVFGWDFQGSSAEEINLRLFDLREYGLLKKELLLIQPDLLIHCAGCADVGKSVQNPQYDFHGNVTVTHNLLFAVHETGLKKCRVVFLSSAAVYGTPDRLPVTENTILKPLSPYALHKAMAEQVCSYFYDNYRIDVKVIRIFSAYGSGLRKQIFWDMFQKAENTGKLQMFGTGNESRDYIHIEDLLSAIYLVALKAPEEERVYNIANGEEVTIRRVTEIFAAHYGIAKEAISFNGVIREGEPINWRADITKLLSLGYKKKVSMEKGVESYIEWAWKLMKESSGT